MGFGRMTEGKILHSIRNDQRKFKKIQDYNIKESTSSSWWN